MQRIQQLVGLQARGSSVVGIAVWIILFIRQGEQLCTNKLLRIIIFFNIITLQECLNNWKSIISIAIILQLTQKSLTIRKKLLLIWLLILDPFLIPVYLLHSYIQKGKNQLTKINLIKYWLQIMSSLGICFISAYYFNNQAYFLTQYSKNSGVTWIFYSHLFQRYVALFQVLLFILPFLCIFPLVLINCQNATKIAVQFYICIFVFPNTSLIHLWALIILQSKIYTAVMEKLNKQRQIVWNTLTIMAAVISISSYSFYERLISLWTHTHLVSVGYFFIQLLLFWGVHAVYLAEALIIMDYTLLKPKKKLITKIKEYIEQRIKQL